MEFSETLDLNCGRKWAHLMDTRAPMPAPMHAPMPEPMRPVARSMQRPSRLPSGAINLHRLDRINALYGRQMLAGSQPQG